MPGILTTLFIAIWIAVPFACGAEKTATAGASGVSQEGLHVPVLGFVAKADGTGLRPVLGVPGAAVLGDPVALPESATQITISPAASFALVSRSDGQPLSVLPIDIAGGGSMQPIDGALEQYDAIQFSASGATAALYSAANGRIQVVTGLPDSPTVRSEFDVSSLSAPVVSLAVADDAAFVLAGTSDGQNGAVYRITRGNSFANILTGVIPTALRLAPQADSVLVADGQANRVWMVSTLSGTPSARQLASSDDGVNAPNQIELLAGDRTAVIANLNALLFVDLQLGTSSSIPIAGPAVRFQPIRMRSGLAVLTAAPPAYWLVNIGPDGPAVSLIADLATSAGKQ